MLTEILIVAVVVVCVVLGCVTPASHDIKFLR